MGWREVAGQIVTWGGVVAGAAACINIARRAYPRRPKEKPFDWGPETKELMRQSDEAARRSSRLMKEAGGVSTRQFPEP